MRARGARAPKGDALLRAPAGRALLNMGSRSMRLMGRQGGPSCRHKHVSTHHGPAQAPAIMSTCHADMGRLGGPHWPNIWDLGLDLKIRTPLIIIGKHTLFEKKIRKWRFLKIFESIFENFCFKKILIIGQYLGTSLIVSMEIKNRIEKNLNRIFEKLGQKFLRKDGQIRNLRLVLKTGCLRRGTPRFLVAAGTSLYFAVTRWPNPSQMTKLMKNAEHVDRLCRQDMSTGWAAKAAPWQDGPPQAAPWCGPTCRPIRVSAWDADKNLHHVVKSWNWASNRGPEKNLGLLLYIGRHTFFEKKIGF